MKRLKFAAAVCVPVLSFSAYLVIGSQKSYSQAPPPPPRLANASIAAQVLGRVKIQSDLSVGLYGYFTIMEGVPGPIFSGPPSESTAMLTYAAEPTAATLIRNGDVVQGIEKPLNGAYTILNVYYNAAPSTRDILNPDDFKQGQLIAKFRSRAAVVNVAAPGSFNASTGIVLDTADDFTVNGSTVNFGTLANGLSLTLFGPAPALTTIAEGLINDGSFSIQLSGTGYVAATNPAPPPMPQKR